MTNKERSAAIRAEIKKLGYNSRQVSVRSRNCGYSDETRIEVKDLSCDIKAIEKACMKFESIDYDPYSGEILSGAKAIAEKLSANIEIQEYNQYNWTAIRIYYGSGLFERFIALLSIPHDTPVLRVFKNDKPRIFKDFAEFEEYARKNAEIQKNIRFGEIPNYD